MTLAVCKSLLEYENDLNRLHDIVIENMVKIGRNHSQCGFGRDFFKWIIADNHNPYGSYGNGAAMRIGCCGIVGNSIDEVKELSKIITGVSHNHEESFKGAEAISVAVFMAKNNSSKKEIEEYIKNNYYKLNFTLEEKRKLHGAGISCQDCVPQAFLSFFESRNFEDAIRNAISIGGDSDTVAAITGCLAGVYYGIPRKFIRKANTFFVEQYDYDLIKVINKFERKYPTKKLGF